MIIGKRETSCRRRIRQIFLDPAESYSLTDVARLTGLSAATLRREARRGWRDASKQHGCWRFRWQQLASLALERWTLAEIYEALGADAQRVLPPLLALRRITVRLPDYVVRALETLATARGTTIDHYLYGELIDFASTASMSVGLTIPGYRQAYLFPGHDRVSRPLPRFQNGRTIPQHVE
jgi:hypothetical protein